MNRVLSGDKRAAGMSIDQIQRRNASWWNAGPLDYDWGGELPGAWLARVVR